MRPRNATKIDWEVELGVVIGKPAKYVTADEALNYVAGYCVVNDLSERYFQMHSPVNGQKVNRVTDLARLAPIF